MFPKLIHLVASQYFLSLYGSLFRCVGIPNFTHSSIDGHVFFSTFTIMNNPAMNILTQVFVHDFFSVFEHGYFQNTLGYIYLGVEFLVYMVIS